MKKYIVYILIIAVTAFSSCEDFLNTDSPSSFTDEYIFSNVEDAQKAVMSVYAMFNQDSYTSRLSNVFTGNSDIEHGGVGAAPDASRRDIWSLEARYSASFSDLATTWNNTYKAINRANECIEGLQRSTAMSDPELAPEMKQLLGEAYTLRAFWYYILTMYWADVPFLTKATKAGDELYVPRYDRDSILSTVIDDLIAVEEDMLWADQLNGGIERINREFVLGMISRISLARAGYSMRYDGTMKQGTDPEKYYGIAKTYAEKLIALKDRELNPNFGQIFLNQCKYISPVNDDVLYEVAFQSGFGDVAWNMGIRVDAGSHPYGSGSAYLTFPLTYFYSFDAADNRRDVTCALYYYDGKNVNGGIQQPTGPTSISPGKWNRLWLNNPPGSASAKGTGINWPVMRYSDVLLMLAEAENALNGPTDLAKQQLKRVRKRAFSPDMWPTKVDAYVDQVAASQDDFFNAIVEERALEFGGECMRKYDLIRWNIYGPKIAKVRNELKQMGLDAYTASGDWGTYPDYLYYKRDETTGKITYMDYYNRPDVVPTDFDATTGMNPDGWYRVGWLRSMAKEVVTAEETTYEPADYVLRQWRGYTPAMEAANAPAPYVLPIHTSIIISAGGILENKGYTLDLP